MTEIKIGGAVSLVGFDKLNAIEIESVNKLVDNFVRKLNEQPNYNSLKLELRIHTKGKAFLHEINASANVNNRIFKASHEDYNLYACLNKLSEKILSEINHNKRNSREIGEERLKKQRRKRINEVEE